MNATQPQYLEVNQLGFTSTAQPATIQFNENEIYMTSKEVMNYLGISRSTLCRYCKTNKLPYYKLGGRVF